MTGKDLRLIWLFYRAIEAVGAADADAHELSPVQFFALRFICLHDRPNLGAIAESLAVSNAAATKLVDRLVRKGLVARVPDAVDHREKRLTLTEKGQRFFTANERAGDEKFAGILDRLAPGEREMLFSGLEAFLEAALSDAESVRQICLRCGRLHEIDCPGEKIYRKRGGKAGRQV